MVLSHRTRSNEHELKYKKLHLKTRIKHFDCDNGQTLEHTAQRHCGVSILGDTQNPPRHSPEQPDLPDPDLNTECIKQSPKVPASIDDTAILCDYSERKVPSGRDKKKSSLVKENTTSTITSDLKKPNYTRQKHPRISNSPNI